MWDKRWRGDEYDKKIVSVRMKGKGTAILKGIMDVQRINIADNSHVTLKAPYSARNL